MTRMACSATMGETKNVYIVLVWKSEGKAGRLGSW
jgi:hypothetical protein